MFRELYGVLAASLDESMSDEDACRLLVKSAGASEGCVGKEKVYGGEILQRLLEHKQRPQNSPKSLLRVY